MGGLKSGKKDIGGLTYNLKTFKTCRKQPQSWGSLPPFLAPMGLSKEDKNGFICPWIEGAQQCMGSVIIPALINLRTL